jgi:dCTP deaminase
MILSAQTIRHYALTRTPPLITPFVEKGVIRGRSFGLSACTYDCRIADALLVPVGQSRLASSLERFCLPADICAQVMDKSTWARVFLTAFNTHLDPGWEGFLTVELSNLGSEVAEFLPGDPLVQIKFEFLDQRTQLPYAGKYQNQEAGPQGPRYGGEAAGGVKK